MSLKFIYSFVQYAPAPFWSKLCYHDLMNAVRAEEGLGWGGVKEKAPRATRQCNAERLVARYQCSGMHASKNGTLEDGQPLK